MLVFEPSIDRDSIDSAPLANGYEFLKRAQLRDSNVLDSDSLKRAFGENALIRLRSADIYLGARLEIEDAVEQFQSIAEQSSEKLDRLLLALNINERIWNFREDIRLTWVEADVERNQISSRHFWPRLNFNAKPTVDDVREASELTRKIDMIYAEESRYRSVRTALSALQNGSYNFGNSIRYLQECIALEALCSGSTAEVTHRIAATCAILLESRSGDRKSLYDRVRDMYNIRSGIIHGGGHLATIEELKDIEQLTRKILRRVFTEEILPNYESATMQKEFLLKLALEGTISGESPD